MACSYRGYYGGLSIPLQGFEFPTGRQETKMNSEEVRQSLKDRDNFIKAIKASNLEDSVKKVIIAIIKATFR